MSIFQKKKIVTHIKKWKSVTHMQEKTKGNRNCERSQISHLIDTGSEEAIMNMFKEQKRNHLRKI